MYIMKTIITVLLTCLVLSCTKSNDEKISDQLPPITTNGANTAGFLISGKVVIPKNASQAICVQLIYG